MKPAFVVRWQSPVMPAPAFWYFATRAEADSAVAEMRPQVVATVEETSVPDDFELDEG